MERDLYSEMFARESGELIARFKAREVTGPEVYEWWDGCLIDDMLSEEGNAFSEELRGNNPVLIVYPAGTYYALASLGPREGTDAAVVSPRVAITVRDP